MVHPLLERELAAIMRGGFRKMSWRMLALLLGVNLVVEFVCLFVAGPGPFQFLLHFYLALAIGAVIYATAGAAQGLFAVESQRGTMPLVLLTSTRPWQLILIKLTAPLLTSALLLSLLIPFLLSVAPATRVPTATLLGCVAFIAGLTMLFTASTAWGSVRSGQNREGNRIRTLFFGSVYLGPMALFFIAHTFGIRPGWLDRVAALSPIMTGMKAVTGLGTIPPGELLLCGGFMAVAAVLAIGATGMELRRLGRDAASGSEAASIGGGTGKPAFKSENYPYAGIAATDRSSVKKARLWIGGIAVLWLVGFTSLPWLPLPELTVLAAAVQFAVLYWQSSISMARRVADDRSSGMLELLIVSGLTPKSIAIGLGLGAVRQFDPVIRTTAVCWAIFGIALVATSKSPVVDAIQIALLTAGGWAALFAWRKKPNYKVACHALEQSSLEAAISASSIRRGTLTAIWWCALAYNAMQGLGKAFLELPDLGLFPAIVMVAIAYLLVRLKPAPGSGHFVVLFEALVAQDQRPVPPDDSKAGAAPAPWNGKA